MPLIYLSCAWIAGVFIGSKFGMPPVFVLTGLIPLVLLFRFRRHQKPVILLSLCLVAFFAGAVRFQSSLPAAGESSLRFYNDRGSAEIKGIVSADPEVRDKSTRLRLSASMIKLENGWREVSGTALLFVPGYPAYRYGDVLLVKGELETPPRLDDFDYGGYLARREIYSTMLYPGMEILERGRGFKPMEWIYSARNRLSQSIAASLPEPQASLAQGILLGKRDNIPSSVRDDFSRTGTAHILAISGLHLSIMAGILLSLGIWLFGRRRYIYIWLALGAVWLYALLTGMNPPVVRAAIMVSLFLTAELLGRQRSALTSLAFAAAVMIGVSPLILWTASFQMSFLAMLGLLFIAPPLQRAGQKAANAVFGEDRPAASIAGFAADSLGISLGAVLAVWPVIAYYFGIVAFASPVATFLVLPALPGAIIASAIAGGFGLIVLPVAHVIGWLAWLFLSYTLLVVKAFAALPSYVEITSVNINLIWGYYLALAASIWLGSNRRKLPDPAPVAAGLASRLPVRWVLPPLLAAAVMVSLVAATLPDDNLHVSFLDVGEGDATLVQTPDRQDILIDGGPSPQALSLELSERMPFWDRTIELVILTHPHADHLTGLIEVLRRYDVKQVLSPDLDYDSPAYDEWLRLIGEKNIKYTVARAGQRIYLNKGAVITVLNPQSPLLADTASDIDNNGIVLRLSLGDFSFLFTADIQQEAEMELIAQRADLNSAVLKVAHHGSDTSTSSAFLSVVNPRLAVISVGADNRFSHPDNTVMERLIEKVGLENIYRTDERGTVEFVTDGEKLRVRVKG